MPRLVVVLPLRPLAVGDSFALRDWPLHLTVVPTFVIDADLATVWSAIAPLLAPVPALTVRAGHDEGFGRSAGRPVTLIEPTAAVLDLHRSLLAALLALGARFDEPDFTGSGYRPHVTVKGTSRVRQGHQLTLRQAAIVDMAPASDQRGRAVVWVTDLGAATLTPPR